MIIQMNLQVRHYKTLRNQAIDKGFDIYPPYDDVLAMKELCTPKNIKFSDDEAVATIQDVLDHRIFRILQLNPEIFDEMQRIKSVDESAKFILYYKYGCGE